MSGLGHPPGDGTNLPEIRVSDRDREQYIDLLRRHCGEGRISLDEFSDRVGLVLAARVTSELEAVVADLPVAASNAPERAEQTTKRRPSRWIIAVMSGNRRRGRWRVADNTYALAVMGGCHLDLRGAEIQGQEVKITALSVMGSVDVIVPEGFEVELSGLSIMGGRHVRVADVPRIPGSPLIRVRGLAIMGGVVVRTRRDRNREGRALGEGGSRDSGGRGRDRPSLDRGARGDIREAALDGARRRAGDALDRARDEWDAALAMVPPDPGTPAPPAPDGTVTILFSDVTGSTQLYERLGDVRAGHVLSRHFDLLREMLERHHGYEVKTQGDGIMAAFASASRALRCAVDIQRALARSADDDPVSALRVHIGLHTGEAIRDNNDFLGRTVILASRISDAAAADEILVSSLLKELAESSGEFTFGAGRQVELKGLREPRLVFPVEWGPQPSLEARGG